MGGEQWEQGKTYNIIWRSEGVDKVDISFVDYVQPYPPGSTGPWGYGFASDIPANQEEYSWTVPSDLRPGDKYKINISWKERKARFFYVHQHDESDNYFSIILPVPEDETANWKTYQNEEYGVGFLYPKDWKIIYDKSGYQRAACDYLEYRKTDPTCVKSLQIGLGKTSGISLLDINSRQCLNMIELPGYYICFDSALPFDKRGTYLDTTGERLKYLDLEVRNAIKGIKDTFKFIE